MFLLKTGENTDLDIDSDICFDYMPNVFLSEQKFQQKKYRLKYNGKPVDIIECVTEHNTGVFFMYKNRSTEFKLQVVVQFNKFQNLYLSLLSSDIFQENKISIRPYIKNKFRNDNDDSYVELIVAPGEVGFFLLTAADAFEKFSYSCQCDYHFSLSKGNGFGNLEGGSVGKEQI